MFLIIFLVWLILNARLTAEIICFGLALSAILFLFMCFFLDYSIKKEIFFYLMAPFFLEYGWVLVGEIVKANLAVIKIIMRPDMVPEPALVYFDAPFSGDLAKVMLANSITLTPGTITVSVEGQHFCVHCLDAELGEDLENIVFVRLLEKFERSRKKWLG